MSLLGDVQDLFSGLEQEVPLFDGHWRRYVNLDNAATTPPFKAVVDYANRAFNWYGSVHRGTGLKSQLSTHLYERCRDLILRFVDADPFHHTLIFCSNTTDAINRLCRCLLRKEDEVVLTTIMEHHSNLLPWRFSGRTDYVDIYPSDGSLNIKHLENKLREHAGKVKMVTVTGASNVTGFISPIREIATLAHRYGAKLLVDAAQLIAHRTISMGPVGDRESIDFLAFSGHKMYAPFGSGGLIGPQEWFVENIPFPTGGGAAELVTQDEIEWADIPERQEAGTPNLIGVLTLSKAVQTLQSLGMENVAEHERELTGKALRLLNQVPGVKVFGDTDPTLSRDRVGVISFVSQQVNHALLATILSYEYGVGVRHGCFCAHLYLSALLGLNNNHLASYLTQIRGGDRSHLPGFVRLSLGIYNTAEEIEYFAEAVEKIITDGPQGRYYFDQRSNLYVPEGFSYDFDSLFTL
jgi:selenocysteine lyase/cysteine desulfurase